MKSNSSTFQKKLTKISLILFILFSAMFGFGYLAAFLAPQYADTNIPPSYTVYPNDNKISFSIALSEPSGFFGSPKYIHLNAIHDNGNLSFVINTKDIANESEIKIDDAKFILKGDGTYNCYSETEDSNISAILKNIHYSKILKRIRFDGTLEVKAGVFTILTSCYNNLGEKESVLINTNPFIINFSQKGSVFYEWSGKGGPTYRL